MKKKEITVPILNDEYKVIVCFGNQKQIEKTLKRWGHTLYNNEVLNYNRGNVFHTNGCHPVIVLPRFPKTSIEIGTLAHEAVHAVGYIFSMIGQQQAEEVYAHSVSAIVRNVLKKMKGSQT